jgi:hypothetical protein
MVARSASLVSRCSRRVAVTWATILEMAASITPTAMAALMAENQPQHDPEHDLVALAILAEHGGRRHGDVMGADRAGGVAAQAEAVERPGDLQARRVGGHQPDGAGAVGGQRPAGPEVGVGLADGGHPALGGVQPHAVAALGGGGDRRPEMAAGTRLRERQGGQVPTRGDLLADRARSVRLDHGGRSIVHADHHRGGPAGAGQPLDHLGGGAQPLATPADLAGADQAEQAGPPEGVDGRAR